jgi:hypothetical protein
MKPAGARAVIVPHQTSDNTFDAAPGAMLTEAQYASYKAGAVRQRAQRQNPGGEIRAR